MAIDAGVLAPALAEAMPRLGWSADVAAVYCVEKLKRMGSKARRPAQFLAADLGRLNGDLVASPRMMLADVLSRLDECSRQAREMPDHERPHFEFIRELLDADLLADSGDDTPDAFTAKTAHLEQIIDIAEDVVLGFDIKRSAAAPPTPLSEPPF